MHVAVKIGCTGGGSALDRGRGEREEERERERERRLSEGKSHENLAFYSY